VSARPDTGAAVIRAPRRDEVARVWELVGELADYEKLAHEVVGSAAALEQGLFASPPPVEGLVLEVGGALEGYALFYLTYSSFWTAPMMWLEDLYVTPGARGAGYGRALLAAVARRAVERGCRRLGWIVLDWNEPSIRFYESLGARPSGPGWLQYGFDEATLRAVAGEAGAPG
jgi:GNAT superfamily N-acetyltransferase